MPKTSSSFEYIDGRGRKHRVNSIKKVPKEYIKTLVVTGGEEAGAETTTLFEETAADGGTGHSENLIQGDEITPMMVVALIFVIGWFFAKNFLGRVILGVFALMVGFFLWFGWFQSAGDKGTKTWKEFDKEMKDRRKRPGIGEYLKKEYQELQRQSER